MQACVAVKHLRIQQLVKTLNASKTERTLCITALYASKYVVT